MRIVMDTNVLLAGFSVKSKTHWLWQSFRQKRFVLCVSTEILDEYAEIFERKYSFEAAELAIDIILESPNSLLITEYYHWNLITTDADDNKFVDTALMGNADYIVTNDKLFNVLKKIKFPPIKVLNVEEFKKVLKYF